MNNNINKILNEMNFVVNEIASETGLTVSEANELILSVSKFMIDKKDEYDKAGMTTTIMTSIISSMDIHIFNIFKIALILNYANEQICLISGSSDSAWKIIYLTSELFQNSNSMGNKVNDENINKNNQSDDEQREFTISEGLKSTLTNMKLPSNFYKDAIDARKSLVANKKVMDEHAISEKIDLSSCAYISEFNIDIDFLKIKMNNPAVMIRAGYGKYSSQKDAKFEENYKNAKANSLKVGAYWYSYAYTAEEAIQEVRAFLQVIAGKRFDIPIAFDIEQNYPLDKVIGMRSEIIEIFTLVRSYCNMYDYNVQFITLDENGKIGTIDIRK